MPLSNPYLLNTVVETELEHQNQTNVLRFIDRKFKPLQRGQYSTNMVHTSIDNQAKLITAPFQPMCGYNLWLFSCRDHSSLSHVGKQRVSFDLNRVDKQFFQMFTLILCSRNLQLHINSTQRLKHKFSITNITSLLPLWFCLSQLYTEMEKDIFPSFLSLRNLAALSLASRHTMWQTSQLQFMCSLIYAEHLEILHLK